MDTVNRAQRLHDQLLKLADSAEEFRQLAAMSVAGDQSAMVQRIARSMTDSPVVVAALAGLTLLEGGPEAQLMAMRLIASAQMTQMLIGLRGDLERVTGKAVQA
jgi:hypothetical protein